MGKRIIVLLAWTIWFLPLTISAQPSARSRIFYGGGIGLGFGDVEYVELAPMMGIRFNYNFSVGVSFMYRWVSDTRFATDIETEDFGANVFARYHVSPNAYFQVEYEYLDYEIYVLPLEQTERHSFSSTLAGGGVAQPVGQRTYAYATVLYNFSYNDQLDNPYNDPWVYRFGMSVGF